MKIPGPDHPITIAKNDKRVRVTFAGHAIADTRGAFTLREASYKPVFYIPRSDADMSLLKRTDHQTHCPYKGDASYYSVAPSASGDIVEDVIWTYDQPYPAVADIAGHVAFYPDKAEVVVAS